MTEESFDLYATIICCTVYPSGKWYRPLQISTTNQENVETKMCYFTDTVEYQVLRNV